jgi:hypothetical protein
MQFKLKANAGAWPAWVPPAPFHDGYKRPMEFRLLIRREPPADGPALSPRQQEDVEWFERNYDILDMRIAHAGDPPPPLGDPARRHCRYCGRSTPDTTFDQVSHAFPHMIGNKWLIDHWECDACNKQFSKAFENDFASWTLPLRGIAAVEGGKGVPTLVSPDQKIRISMTPDGRRRIDVQDGAQGWEVDPEDKSLTIVVNRPRFRPLAAYKALVKMALAVMPSDEAARCKHLFRWVLEEELRDLQPRAAPLLVACEFIAGPIPNDAFAYGLLRRKLGAPDDSPFLIFFLQFANQVFQIFLPMPAKDRRLVGKTVNMRRFPHPWATPEHAGAFAPPTMSVEDLHSPKWRRAGQSRMKCGFDRLELVELPVEKHPEADAGLEAPRPQDVNP